jgi:excisionase family DNA binding protein
MKQEKLLTISEASKLLGVAKSTLRRWEEEGKLIPDVRTKGGQRRYKLSSLLPEMKHKNSYNRKTIAYARVSSYDQKDDLERQKQVLEMYCASNGWDFEILSDLGSGINYNKKGLKTLIHSIIDGEVGRLVVTHKDRLLRFGAELIFAICEAKEVEVVIINKGEDTTFEEDLAKDVLEIITVFSARLYGARSHKNKKLIDGMKKVVDDISTQD